MPLDLDVSVQETLVLMVLHLVDQYHSYYEKSRY